MAYSDRREAGRVLAQEIVQSGEQASLALGVARGGIVVAAEVAAILDIPLDVIVPRKIGAPDQPELAIGAISLWGDAVFLDQGLARMVGADDRYVEIETQAQRRESERRLLAYRGTVDPPDFQGSDVIIVDDGIATGYTLLAAAQGLRNLNARRIVVAAPVGAPDSIIRLSQTADAVVCPLRPVDFFAVGSWYQDFRQVSDQEVIEILRIAARGNARDRPSETRTT